MKLILENLYLGDYEDAMNIEQLSSIGVTHILSVCAMHPKMIISNTFTHSVIPVEDMDHVNILIHFESAIKFIESALSIQQSILIHCAAGISRSVSIITAYIMKSQSLTYDDAITIIKQIDPAACPNSGFIQQLELFHEMNYTIDPHFAAYKQFRITSLANEYQENGFINQSNLTALTQTTSQTSIRCKKCRYTLALSQSIIPHSPSTGQSQFHYFKRDATDEVQCALLFVEPMEWMGEAVKNVEGKLMCPGCKCKIGAFNWYGMQCSCGSWNAPAFTIPRKVVDEMKCIRPAE